MNSNVRKVLLWFKPKYNELTVYLAVVSSILLFAGYPELRLWYEGAWGRAEGRAGGWLVIVSLVALTGAVLAVYNAFAKRHKAEGEKTAMAAFAMGANGVAGLAYGIQILPEGLSIAAIFPAWNILTGVGLLYQIGLTPEDVITDEDVTRPHVCFSTLALAGIFSICRWYLQLHWPVTFSICMCYASLPRSAGKAHWPWQKSRA